MIQNCSYVEIRNMEDYISYRKSNFEEYETRAKLERDLARDHIGAFNVSGVDPISNEPTSFSVSKDRPIEKNGVKSPHWRESLICNRYHLNARLRAAVLLYNKLSTKNTEKVYLTEKITQLYSYFESVIKPKTLVGSEYYGSDISSGEIVNSVRHEDLTRSSFGNNEFDAVVCLEVLEHIPDYSEALKEIYRILKRESFAVFSAPFIANKYETTIRATVNSNGSINHLLEPEYHGDPINKKGVLCFQHFGWDIIDLLSDIGFKEVNVVLLWSREYGVLGLEQLLWYARK